MIEILRRSLFLALIFASCSRGVEREEPQPGSEPEEEFSDPAGPEDLDFSRVGYHWGDSEIPDYPVGRTISVEDVAKALSKGEFPDTTSFLNDAIASAPSGKALLLKAGEYRIHSALKIERGNFVLRGEGADKTVIVASACPAENHYNCLKIGPDLSLVPDMAAVSRITDAHVPVGAMYVDVESPALFRRGDNVFIFRKATEEWISDIKMDLIDDPVHPSWTENMEALDLKIERRVVKVSGSRLYLDNPIPMDLDSKYGSVSIWRCTHNRVSEVGLENIGFCADYDTGNPYDEDHAYTAVAARACEHCWIRGVESRHFFFSCVSLSGGARCVTVDGCRSLKPVSQITGSRRYAFSISKRGECNLVKNCTADEDRHMFVSPAHTDGPNVFLRCTGTNCHSNGGPHCYWATLFLYDNVTLDNKLSVEDVGGEAELSSHGWQGANHVLWNCTATAIVCQDPWATGHNYAYGCVGQKLWGTYFNQDPYEQKPEDWKKGDKWRPDGQWSPAAVGGSSCSERVSPESLYESQLESRHAAGTYVYPLPETSPRVDGSIFTLDLIFVKDGQCVSPFIEMSPKQNSAVVIADRTFTVSTNSKYKITFKASKLRLVWGNKLGLELTAVNGDYMTIPDVSGKKLFGIGVFTSSSREFIAEVVDATGKTVGTKMDAGSSNFYSLVEGGSANKLLFTSDASYSCITRITLNYK